MLEVADERHRKSTHFFPPALGTPGGSGWEMEATLYLTSFSLPGAHLESVPHTFQEVQM